MLFFYQIFVQSLVESKPKLGKTWEGEYGKLKFTDHDLCKAKHVKINESKIDFFVEYLTT